MRKNLVVQHLRNQLACKEIMSMMNIVNIFIRPTDYLCVVLWKNDHKKEPEHCEKCTHMYSGHWNLQTWTWKSMVAEAQLCQSKFCPRSEGTERSQDWETECWQQGQEQQPEPWILVVDINLWNTERDPFK